MAEGGERGRNCCEVEEPGIDNAGGSTGEVSALDDAEEVVEDDVDAVAPVPVVSLSHSFVFS